MTFLAQEAGGGQIGLMNDSLGVEGKVTDRCRVVELAEPIAGVLQIQLGSSQFVILHFQLDLVNFQFVDDRLQLDWR